MIETLTHFTDDQRRRSRHFDLSIENTAELLGRPQAVIELGAVAVENYNDLLERLKLPNFNNGVVNLAHLSDDAIPFIPLLSGDKLTIKGADVLPSPPQRPHIINAVGEKWAKSLFEDNKTNESFQEASYYQENDFHIGCHASHWFCRPHIFRRKEWRAIGRPYIIERNKIHISQYPPLLIHELTHAKQYEQQPIWDEKQDENLAVGRELEAYHMQILATQALKTSLMPDRAIHVKRSGGYTDYANRVEFVRRRYADRSKPFMPTRRMIDALVANDLDITGGLISS